MKTFVFLGLFFLKAALAAPEMAGFKALEADGDKYISRVHKGLIQYQTDKSDPLFDEIKNLRKRNLLENLNQKVNETIRYTSDMNLYGEEDHWATFEEVSSYLKGDCEDYALLKYWALRELGIPADSMHLLVFYDQISRIHHAVLVVKKDKEQFVLDNRASKVYKLKQLTDILPNMAMNEKEFFIYGKVKR